VDPRFTLGPAVPCEEISYPEIAKDGGKSKARIADQKLLLKWYVETKGNTVVSDAACVINVRSIRGIER